MGNARVLDPTSQRRQGQKDYRRWRTAHSASSIPRRRLVSPMMLILNLKETVIPVGETGLRSWVQMHE